MNTLSIRNPRTGVQDFSLEVFDADKVEFIVAELRQNQSAWFLMGVEKRVAHLALFAQALTDNKQALVDALVADTGRYTESVLEVDVTISGIQRWCKQAPELFTQQSERQAEIPFLNIKQSQLPYQCVGVISPWNFPLLLSLVDAIPALLAGCSIILKPSEVTSRFVKPFIAALNKVPALRQVFSVVTGAGETGQTLINNVDSICFTGSVATGRKVGESCAKRFIPAFLELGGKDPAIVCGDANVDMAAKALCWGSMVNAGQSCMSIERVYVHQDIADEFKQKLTANVAQLKHNYPDLQQGQVGPIISDKQVAIVKAQLADAKAKGATFLCGGEVLELGGGHYCQPTLITDVTPDMLVVKEETFAAVLPIFVVASDEEGVQRANDSIYGLSAAVFSENIQHAEMIASQLEAGAISINDASLTALVHEIEKQSFKYSGLGGSRMGKDSINRFVRKKAFIRNSGVASPWWF